MIKFNNKSNKIPQRRRDTNMITTKRANNKQARQIKYKYTILVSNTPSNRSTAIEI